jgi:Arc/MetJ-type ribon-helix-helix transcriptional regulator
MILMEFELTPEESDLIRRAVDTGRVKHPEDAVHQALELWIERERGRDEILAEIDEAEASVVRGKVRIMPSGSARKLAKEVHKRGMARLAAARSKRG